MSTHYKVRVHASHVGNMHGRMQTKRQHETQNNLTARSSKVQMISILHNVTSNFFKNLIDLHVSIIFMLYTCLLNVEI